MKNSLIFITLLFMMAGSSSAAVIYVPDDYPTITEAIDASEAGGTVLVRPGIYYEHNINTHYISLLASTDGPEITIIDGEELYAPVVSVSGAIIDGFTIRNGYTLEHGSSGGINVSGNSIVKNCWIIENSGSCCGGGLKCLGASGDILIINSTSAGKTFNIV